MLNLVRDVLKRGKVVAAICHAGWVLASAGVLKGRKATSVSAIKDDMVNAGATWLDQEVVVDGALITSRTPADLPAFCRTIIAVMEKQAVTARMSATGPHAATSVAPPAPSGKQSR